MKRILLVFILFSKSSILFINAQSLTLRGQITDSVGQPLAFANIIADPLANASLAFAISDNAGHYKIVLEKGEPYHITISYLGYAPKSLDFTSEENQNKDFRLIQISEELGEVSINYRPPVVVKTDTIIYHTDAFTTGEERKLRDVLKRLPAVEVDRDGNVTVNGKKVTKVLVEGKQFFTGDSQLAVNNIPADVVDEIEVLDNYSEVGFLKGLEDSEDMAMNVKLKQSKKRFIFGEIEAGGGFHKRYLFHPSLYFYSPKITINAISDFNNIGNKSFTVKDYLEFEGGRNKLITDAQSYFSLLNDDFTEFLANRDFTKSLNQFEALSISQAINKKTDLSAYGIWSNMKNETQVQTLNDYLASDNLIENRIRKGEQKSDFIIGKLNLKHKPSNDNDLSFESYVKTSTNRSQNLIKTLTEENEININTKINAENISFKQKIEWHRQFNKKNTSSMVFNYLYQKAIPNVNWISDDSILEGLLPVIDEDTYNISKEKETQSHNINLIIKHYWVLNRVNHMYFTLSSQLNFDNYITNEYQRLEDGSINNFLTSNFGNDIRLNYNDTFIGVHYKLRQGKITFKPGIFYHYYNLDNTQFGQHISNKKALILPELKTDVEFSNSKKLTFQYKLKTRFPSIAQLANRYTMVSFNSIYRGNETLENELYHYAQLDFFRFSLSKDVFYNLTASYRAKEDNFKNITSIHGIDFLSSPVLSDFEDKVLGFSGNLKKGFGKYKFLLKGSIILANYDKPINTEIVANTSNNYSFGGGVETRFKNFPNFELGYIKSFSKYSANTNSEFQTNILSTLVEYDFLNDFIFRAEYSYETYENKTMNLMSAFDIANASLLYQKEDNPWGFQIEATNLFNIDYKQQNSFNSFIITDSKTFVMPRIFMFKVIYKL